MVPFLIGSDPRCWRTLWVLVKVLRSDVLRRYELAYPCTIGLEWSQMVPRAQVVPPGAGESSFQPFVFAPTARP